MISGCAWLVIGVLVGVIVGQGHLAADVVDVHVGDVVGQGHLAEHLSPNVSTSVRIFGSAEVRHTTMGTLSGF